MEENQTMNQILEALTQISNRLDSIETRMNEGFTQVGQRFDELETKIVKHGAGQMAKIVSSIESLENRLAGRTERLEKRQDKTAIRLEGLEADVSILQEKLID